jgi:hypothetical protein
LATSSLSDLAAGVPSWEDILGCGATGRSQQAAKRKDLNRPAEAVAEDKKQRSHRKNEKPDRRRTGKPENTSTG